jgi:4-amino-4-deoxy-L-arabinose transferase-like glycosyltransferase
MRKKSKSEDLSSRLDLPSDIAVEAEGINPPARPSPLAPGLYLLAALLALVIFVLPLAVRFPLLDPDEGLHASIAQEMVERGDWLVPHFLGKPFRDKPILYFWFQAISLKCFGMNEFAVRLPGLFLGLIGAITTGIVGGKMFDRTTGIISGIFYGTMILPVALAQAAAHDVALVPCVNLAILLFWQADRANSRKASAGYAAAIGIILGVAILAKGLVGVALVGAAYGSYLLITRQLTFSACCRGALALCIAAAIASIWYLAAERRLPGYLHYYFIERHVLGFATDTQRHGDAPWWLYIPLLLGGGLPWIAYLPATIKALSTSEPGRMKCEPGRPRPRLEEDNCSAIQAEGINPPARISEKTSARLLWCWLIGGTILLSLARSKLITYLWPVFPPVAILAAIAWARLLDGTLGAKAKRSLGTNLMLASLAGPFVLPIAVFAVQKSVGVHFDWPVWIAAGIAGMGTLLPLWFLFRGKWQAMLAAATLATAAQFLVMIGLIVPVVAERYSEQQLAEYFNAPPNGSPYLPARMYFVEERIGSFVFYLQPALRASIAEDQLREIRRPKEPPPRKTAFRPGDTVVVPERNIRRAEGFVELTGLAYRKVGRHRLYGMAQK